MKYARTAAFGLALRRAARPSARRDTRSPPGRWRILDERVHHHRHGRHDGRRRSAAEHGPDDERRFNPNAASHSLILQLGSERQRRAIRPPSTIRRRIGRRAGAPLVTPQPQRADHQEAEPTPRRNTSSRTGAC